MNCHDVVPDPKSWSSFGAEAKPGDLIVEEFPITFGGYCYKFGRIAYVKGRDPRPVILVHHNYCGLKQFDVDQACFIARPEQDSSSILQATIVNTVVNWLKLLNICHFMVVLQNSWPSQLQGGLCGRGRGSVPGDSFFYLLRQGKGLRTTGRSRWLSRLRQSWESLAAKSLGVQPAARFAMIYPYSGCHQAAHFMKVVLLFVFSSPSLSLSLCNHTCYTHIINWSYI